MPGSDVAQTDNLTQMPNRAAICTDLQQIIDRNTGASGDRFAVLFLSCDRFRQINDTLGHAVGDLVLSSIATRLRAALRPYDCYGEANESFSARINGDEFVVVVDHLQRAGDVHGIAERLLELLSKPYTVGKHLIHCGVSMGIAQRPEAVGNADALIQKASIAMAEAKRTGGARYVVFEATVRVADSLGMSTVAEGIETEAQAAVIQQLGCQRGQGYLFSKPLDAADIPAWLTHAASIPA